MALAAAFYGNWIVMFRVKPQGGGCMGKRALQSVEPSAGSIPLKLKPKGFTWHKKLCAFFF